MTEEDWSVNEIVLGRLNDRRGPSQKCQEPVQTYKSVTDIPHAYGGNGCWPRFTVMRSLIFSLLVAWATLQGALALWGFSQDAARRDFGHFVSSAQSWRDRGVLYEDLPRVNLNPPHASIVLFVPLTWMPFKAAVGVWIMVQVATLMVGIFLIARELTLTARLEWIVPLIVASAMTTHNWIEGQVGGLIFVASIAAWLKMRRNDSLSASIAFASLINLKPQLALLLMASSRSIRVRAIAAGAGIAIGGVVMAGPTLWTSWLTVTRARGLQLPPWNVAFAPIIHRSGIAVPVLATYVALALIMCAGTWWATRHDRDIDRLWLLWGLTTLLIAPVAWVYYAAALVAPLISWGERFRWPFLARAGILLWLVPLQAVSWVTAAEPSLQLAVIGSPYTWGALLLWMSVAARRTHSDGLPVKPSAAA
jgi:hypothetical protein